MKETILLLILLLIFIGGAILFITQKSLLQKQEYGLQGGNNINSYEGNGIVYINDKNKAIDRFWQWFQDNNTIYINLSLKPQHEVDVLFSEMDEQLRNITTGIAYEFSGIPVSGNTELIISADGIKEKFQDAQNIFLQAPRVPGWDILAFRQKNSKDSIEYAGYTITAKDTFFSFQNHGEKIDIDLYIQDFDNSEDQKRAVYLLLDGVLGEYDVETKLGGIDMHNLNDRTGESLLPLGQLPDIVNQIY